MSNVINPLVSQLFLDNHVIEETSRVKKIIHSPHKYYNNPLYKAGASWEGTSIHYLGGVHFDKKEGILKAWYAVLSPSKHPEIKHAVCMITSTDGIHWERPELDVYKTSDGQWTNIVLLITHGGGTGAPTIIYEPENTEEPWTMVLSTTDGEGNWDYKGYILRSPDGIHWRWTVSHPNGINHKMHDRSAAVKSDNKQFPYTIISRGSEDLRKWKFVRSAHRVGINENEKDGDPTRVVIPDFLDNPEAQVYHCSAFKYNDLYIGTIYWFWEFDNPIGNMELITSRDTIHWERVEPRTIFLDHTPEGAKVGAFDSYRVELSLSAPLGYKEGTFMNLNESSLNYSQFSDASPKQDSLWFYYLGGPICHPGPDTTGHVTSMLQLGLAELRVDGFCGLRATKFPGYIFTKPMIWPGGELELNASDLGGGGNGNIKTEVLTDTMEVIDGFTAENSNNLSRSGIQTWNGKSLNELRGKNIRFKFCLSNAELFSFKSHGGKPLIEKKPNPKIEHMQLFN